MTGPREPGQPGEPLLAALSRAVPHERVLGRAIDRIAFASDASFYRLVPEAVVLAASIDEVRSLFRLSQERRIPLTFRAAGTSLSGQAISDGLLVEVARHWRGIEVLEGGRAVRVGPGAIGASVNTALRPYGTKIGPDPASIATCTMGGILANNSSGMCCGVSQNAYHTLRSLTLVLPSGTVIDTGDPRADDLLREKEPRLVEGLLALRREILDSPALAARIRSRYLSKNTTGYSLNAFLDHETPARILAHAVVGSEGTLAFVAGAVLETVPDLPVKATGLLLFPDVHAACSAIAGLNDAGARALELMDRAALRSVERQPGVPQSIAALPHGAAGLLAEFQTADPSERDALLARADAAVAGLRLLSPARFTGDPLEQAPLWKVRSGMLPSVGARRRSGTTVIIEDVAFPVPALAEAAVELNRLFDAHGYGEGIVFGHARDGNLHFVVTQSFNDAASVDRYVRFMDDVVALVTRHDGALKAEHGTGRNMAPFVEREWGREAYAVMRRLKALLDPHGLLNPGVILNDDPRAHVAHLKTLPPVEEEVDRCIECGFCEPRCPSRELTLTPRQRIAVRRELARAVDPAVEADFGYDVLDTCAVDGLCATACPVGIDTGLLTKRLRGAGHTARARGLARLAARRLGLLERALRTGLRIAGAARRIAGDAFVGRLARAAGLPWSADVPGAAPRLPRTSPEGAAAIYLPSCLTRVLGGEAGDPPLADTLVALAARAGVPVHVPPDVAGACCGVPFSSKGFDAAHAVAGNRTVERLFDWTGGGRLPVVVDTSPCAYGLLHARDALTAANAARFDRLTILDPIRFVAERLLPRLTVHRRDGSVVLHPVCSAVKMGLTETLASIAGRCAVSVVVPASAGCCGFAGDRGFLLPELTAAATRQEGVEAAAAHADGWYASSRTCELGMTRATGRVYRSFLHLVERATREP